ncbi:lysophosphatidylserine lipase ABHD12-like isoform X2 [Babylonia areolata]|uniref:lysophosphatidylserine lipase ABHD12-like isoform X2 n=1 Tax=Babylonia areolata TaxID=304850 RepID=UPI003FD0A469
MPRRTLRKSKRWRRCICYTVILIYGIIPAMALIFPALVAYVTFSYSLPFHFGNLRDPSSAGLRAARHVDLTTPTGDTLGLWHILPESAVEEEGPVPDTEFEVRLASGTPVFIYAHGSGGTRAQFTRVRLYTALRGQGWHVITFDYRGFADSSGEMSEARMVEDTVTVFRWVKQRAGASPVFLWGHSLGTGVATHVARVLSSNNEAPDGIVLEAAFNNIHDLVEAVPLSMPYRPFPFLMRIFQDALKHESVFFTSDQHLVHVTCPTLLLHAEDDRTVPIDLSRKLFQSVVSALRKDQPRVTMHVFPADKGYGHNSISQAPDLGSVVRQFVQDSSQKTEAS